MVCRRLLSALLVGCVFTGFDIRAQAAGMELFMDSDTKQLFAEPGPNRVSIGRFVPADAATAVPTIDLRQGSDTSIPIESLDVASGSASTDAASSIRPAGQTRTLSEGSPWTKRFHARGYFQNRYTTMLGGDEGINLWSDRSVGDAGSLADADKNFLIRRARLILAGDIGEHLSFYLQPDFASSAGGSGNVAQLRDAYADIYLDTTREHRFRIGQSKVPYSFENLQSSSNRLALDRQDALNSSARDERDLGLFYYYTPAVVQQRFADIMELGLKHTGNYGLFGLGVYNGQGANRGDRNDNQHVIARMSYPWQLASGQFFEAGIQAYSGSYVPSVGAYRGLDDRVIQPTVPEGFSQGYDDQRVGVSAIWYPQPFGLQAEWNWGRTPGLNLAEERIEEQSLNGGYVQAMLMTRPGNSIMIPFLRWQYFDGANKAELNAPRNRVNDLELGVEWQIRPELELTAVLHRMHRNNLVTGNREGRPDYERFRSNALRIQLQYNY